MRAAVVVLIALAWSAAAFAQAGDALSAREARAAVFGMQMEGVYEGTGEPARECVDRQGRAFFWRDGVMNRGTVTVEADGQVCFRYPADGNIPYCWWVRREGQGLRFTDSDGFGSDFLARSVRRVRTCQAPQLTS